MYTNRFFSFLFISFFFYPSGTVELRTRAPAISSGFGPTPVLARTANNKTNKQRDRSRSRSCLAVATSNNHHLLLLAIKVSSHQELPNHNTSHKTFGPTQRYEIRIQTQRKRIHPPRHADSQQRAPRCFTPGSGDGSSRCLLRVSTGSGSGGCKGVGEGPPCEAITIQGPTGTPKAACRGRG